MLPIITMRKFSVLDKLWLLWTICLIAHHNEQNTRQELAPTNIRKTYGDRIASKFDFYWKSGMQLKLINDSYMRLLPKGQTVADNWQQISAKLFVI